MRLFIAAELSENILEALAETSALLRSRVRGRYVAPDSFHVTLAFLGEVENGRFESLANVLEDGCKGHRTFSVELGDYGSFGRRSAATLWQGFRDTGQLADLAQSVRQRLQDARFDFDAKPFLPHVTLMRAANLKEGTLPIPSIARGTIGRVALFRSHLSGTRPVYEPLHVVELG